MISPSFASAPLLQKKTLPGPVNSDQPLRQPPLLLIVVKIGAVNQPRALPRQRFGQRGMSVAEAVHGDSAAEIEVAPAPVVPDMPALSMRERQTPIGQRSDILVVKRLDLRPRRGWR